MAINDHLKQLSVTRSCCGVSFTWKRPNIVKTLWFYCSYILNCLASQSFDLERIWWKLLQKRVVPTIFGMYVFIVNTRDNPVRLVLRKGELCNLFIPRNHQTLDAIIRGIVPVTDTLDHILVYQFKHILLFIVRKG